MLFGGSGTQISYDNPGDTSLNGHAADSDTIVADNGRIQDVVGTNGVDGGNFLQFNYDQYTGATEHIIPRAVTLLDYTPGGPDYAGTTGPLVPGDIGGADEIHGEAGDDFIYGGPGSDILYGDGQNDTIIGGYGNDWISGGNGDDGILGDDGRILASIEGTAEPLNGIGALTDPTDGATAELTSQGTGQAVIVNPVGTLTYTAWLIPYNLDPNHANPSSSFVPLYANDIIYGGLGNDSIHGGPGDDAMSGAEAPVQSYANNYDANGVQLNTAPIETDFYHPFNPGNALGYNPTLTYQAQYDPNNPLRKILLTSTGALYEGTINTSTEAASENVAGVYYDWFLNFDANDGPLDDQWYVGSGYPAVPTDGNDRIFGDLGNDWLVGGTGRDTLWGGMGNDLLNADDNLNTANGTNLGTDTNPSYEDLAYGGGGLDVLEANTGGDRLIDWGGEYNSFLVPFDPFGMATVDRSPNPALQTIVTDLALSEGADPMLGAGALAEIGLSIDPGGPRDPQPGNSHGPRDVLRTSGTLIFDTPANPASGAATVAAAPAFIAPTVTDPTVPVNVAMPLTITGPSGTVANYTITDPAGHTLTGTVTLGTTGTTTFTVNVGALGDGTLTSSVLETDILGNQETVTGTPWLKDTTPPTLTAALGTPNNGTSYDVGTPIVLNWTATDAGSGVASTSASIEGQTISASGGTINVDALLAGSHTVTVTSTDRTGNTITTTITFQVHATLKGLVNAVNDGVARGYVTAATASSLISTLKSAMAGNSVHAEAARLHQPGAERERQDDQRRLRDAAAQLGERPAQPALTLRT